MTDAAPRVEEAVEVVERRVFWGSSRETDEAEGCVEEPTAFVEHKPTLRLWRMWRQRAV
jgi:hypothetical protein